MISNQKVKVVGRAAAVLTNAAVASNVVPVNATVDGGIQVYCNFTLGLLTNVIINPQVSEDGTNWYDVTSPGALTITATGKKAFLVYANGAKQFRVTATGTGTVTSSSLSIDFGYQIAGGVVG